MNTPTLRRSRPFRLGPLVNVAFLFFVALIMVLPLAWIVTASLKSSDAIFSVPPQWIPTEYHWENYLTAFDRIAFVRAFGNTVFITVLSVIGQVLSCLLVGYGLARLDFPGKKVWFYVFIGSMMVPGMIGLLPLFQLFKNFGWYNTYFPLIVVNWFGSPFYIFMLRQFFMQIPRTYDEAGTMDGAGHLYILRRLLLPMVKPVVVIIAIMQVQGSWNDYINPLIYLSKESLWTLSMALAQFIAVYNVNWNIFMAADVVYIAPMLVIFFLGQKYFMEGFGSISGSGLKS